MVKEAQSFFGDKAQEYRASKSHANAEDLARMVAWVQPRPGERALDVATGGGHTAMALAEAGCATVATDATPAMLREWPPLPRALCDAQRLPFRRGSFDVVTSRIAPHHFPDLALFAQEAARVLRPGGRFYVFDLTTPEDPRARSIIDHVERLRDPSHGHSYPASAWRAAIARSGLTLARLESRTSTFDLEAWIQRARMSPAAEKELRGILARGDELGGYGARDGKMTVLRVELLARI